MFEYFYKSYLAHYGVEGQKWGVRRYQNKDGSLTPLGKRRYDDYFDEDGGLTRSGRSNLLSVDGYEPKEEFGLRIHTAERYVSKYLNDYGELPINRMRFYSGPGLKIGNRSDGMDYDYGISDYKLSDILSAYDDYRSTYDWD